MSGDKIPLFSRAAIRRLVLPLIVKQFLAVTVGMADTVMVASVEEATVSGTSIMDTLSILLIGMFSTLVVGDTVMASQYLRQKDEKTACLTSSQLVLVGLLLSPAIAALALMLSRQILTSIHGNIEVQAMDYARAYPYLTALSSPFLAVHNGCAAVCRSMGNSQTSTRVFALMNAINIVGNAVLISGSHMKVEGVAIPALTPRVVASMTMVMIVRNPGLQLHIDVRLRLGYNRRFIGEILHIGVPVAVGNGLFQGGKLLVAGLVSSFGTVSTAANAVAGMTASFQVIPNNAISLAMVTVMGQAMGARWHEEARKYALGPCNTAMLTHLAICLPTTLCLPQIIDFCGMPAGTTRLAYPVSLIHGISCVVIWTPSFTLPNALRATDDVGSVILVTLCSVGFCQIVMNCVLGRCFGIGSVGVQAAMIFDWAVRVYTFDWRFFSGGWLKKQKRLEQIL